jgi:hypothetical protein
MRGGHDPVAFLLAPVSRVTALIALSALAFRSVGVIFSARALPPLRPPRRPLWTAAGSLPCSSGVSSRSSISPLAIWISLA